MRSWRLSPAGRASAELLLRKRKEEGNDRDRYDWSRHARPSQLPPDGDWRTWLVQAGRGFGKTRTGAEWVRGLVESGKARRVALVAPTAADARDVMVEGESGLLAVCPPWNKPHYEPSKRRVTWPNGAIATCYSADEPERLRGPQHDHAWCDEVGAWRRPQAWDMLIFGLRLGSDPRVCVTTTPKPTTLVKRLNAAESTTVTGGSTYENQANLAPQFIEEIRAIYEGTRLGEQEIHALLAEIADGAWFPNFSRAKHVTELAEYVYGLPVHVAIDCGTSFCTGAVFFQASPDPSDRHRTRVNVFGDYYADGLYSRANAEAIKLLSQSLCGGRLDRIRLDPASRQRTGVGPVVYGEYEAVFGRLEGWPVTPITDGLDLIEAMLGGKDKPTEIIIHPRCKQTIEAFQNYQRAERSGEWLNTPKDPQHPHEEMIDSLRGGLMDLFPQGRKPGPGLVRRNARNVF